MGEVDGAGRGTGDRWWIHAQNSLTIAVLVLGPLFPRAALASWHVIPGIVFYLVGALVGINGFRALGSNRTPHPRPLEAGQLVTRGLYSRVRHPLYSSVILVTFGWSLFWGSVPALIAASALAILLDQKARVEERYLADKYPGYREYALTVRRFFPGIY